ncbi:MAG: nitrogen fixation protein NifQ [Comamonadaceae bacterium]|nr:nitrogen fixation protein NifQ [Comamonadaceae bacterium]
MNTAMQSRSQQVADLLLHPAQALVANDPLRPILASLLVGRARAEGVLPATLGLSEQGFEALWNNYFPGTRLELQHGGAEEIAELTDLIDLLLHYRAGQQDAEAWLAHIVAWGCAGRHHLWQDLGLANRGELSMLLNTAFPTLAALNTGDMKWKKFIYRHYCSKEGIYVCPAPTCVECADYSRCYSAEN